MIEEDEEFSAFLDIVGTVLFTVGLMFFICMFCAVFNITSDSNINLQIRGEMNQNAIRKN